MAVFSFPVPKGPFDLWPRQPLQVAGRVRVSTQYTEVIHSGSDNRIRLSTQYLEVIHSGSANKVRVSNQYIEIIHTFSDIWGAYFIDADTFYNQAVVLEWPLAPSLFDDTDTFYSPIVGAGNTIAPDLLTDDDTFYTPEIAIHGIFLGPDLFVDTDVFYTPTLGVKLFGTLFVDTDIFYSPVIVAGPITLTQNAVSADDTFYEHGIALVIDLTPTKFVDSDLYYQHRASLGFTPSLFNDQDLMFTPQVIPGPVSLLPSKVLDDEIFKAHNIGIQKKQGGGSGVGLPGGIPKNLKYASSIVMSVGGLIVSLEMQAFTLFQTVNTRMMIYADNAGVPGALLGYTNVKTTLTFGTNSYTLAEPVSVVAGQKIWVAFQSDGNTNWVLTSSPNGSKFNSDLFSDGPSDPFGPASNDNKKAPVFVLYTEAANGSMTATLVVDQETFYTPVITTSKTLFAPFLDEETIWLPTITSSNLLTPQLFADDVFRTHSIAVSYTLHPPYLVDQDVFSFPAALPAGADHIIATDNFAGDDVFFVPVVTTSGANLLQQTFAADDVIWLPAVSSYAILAPTKHTDTETFRIHNVSSSISIVPNHVGNDLDVEQIYLPIVQLIGGTFTIQPQLVEDVDQFYDQLQGHQKWERQYFLDGVAEDLELRGIYTSKEELQGKIPNVNLTGEA